MKIYRTLITAFALLGAAAILHAAGAPKTITGSAKCAKVDLKSQDVCQTVVQVKEGDKTVDYYVADNDAAKAFHKTVCSHPQKVTATGTIETVKGKSILTATKIEPAK